MLRTARLPFCQLPQRCREEAAQRRARRRPPRRSAAAAAAGLALIVAGGCGTSRWTDTPRTATEQLLLSDAIDRAVNSLDFTALAEKRVFFEPKYLQGTVDERYVEASIRQQLLASGCILCEQLDQADYVVEARSGAIGTDRNETFFGMPSLSVPNLGGVVPGGVPAALPEVTLAKNTKQRAVAKLAVVAYNRHTGRPVWQSGFDPVHSLAKNTWFFGAGPFQKGEIYGGTNFAGEPLALVEGGAKKEEPAPPAEPPKRKRARKAAHQDPTETVPDDDDPADEPQASIWPRRVNLWERKHFAEPLSSTAAVDDPSHLAVTPQEVNQAAYLENRDAALEAKAGLKATAPPALVAPPRRTAPVASPAQRTEVIDNGRRTLDEAASQSAALEPRRPPLVFPPDWAP